MITQQQAASLTCYQQYLYEAERSPHTIGKYTRDIKKYLDFLGENPHSKAQTMQFKSQLMECYAPTSVNSILAAVNGYLKWLNLPDCKVKLLKLQQDIFAAPEKELTVREYQRLIAAAEQSSKKLSLLIQTICATGIRVSELQFITVAALRTGRVAVSCKGKHRIIFLPKALCAALCTYCQQQGIASGAVFVTRYGAPLDRSNIWRMLKNLCKVANVPQSKVFPHNLRHLFARTYYKIEKDIGRLADILGHSSINTTRIYTMESGDKHARQIDKMQLLLLQ